MKQLQDFVSDLDSSKPSESTAVPEPHPASGDQSHDATEAKQGEDQSAEGTTAATEPSDDPPKKRMELDDGLRGSEASAGCEDAEAPPPPPAALGHCVVCLGVLQEYCSREHARKVRSNHNSPIESHDVYI